MLPASRETAPEQENQQLGKHYPHAYQRVEKPVLFIEQLPAQHVRVAAQALHQGALF